jgi:hypothetical protein
VCTSFWRIFFWFWFKQKYFAIVEKAICAIFLENGFPLRCFPKPPQGYKLRSLNPNLKLILQLR